MESDTRRLSRTVSRAGRRAAVAGRAPHGAHAVAARPASQAPSRLPLTTYVLMTSRSSQCGGGVAAAEGSVLGVELQHGHAVGLQDARDLAAPALDHGVELRLEGVVAVPDAHRDAERERHARHGV